jgi:rifampin ADP-ribosylating transferase
LTATLDAATWGEVTDWQGHSPEKLKAMKDNLERLRQLGVEAIED